MAETNGFSKHEDTVAVSHLGKRKRTATPEPRKPSDSAVDLPLQDVLQLLRQHDTTPSLLKHPVPAAKLEGPDLKRARTVKSEAVGETIEDRILARSYTSLHVLKEDIKNVHAALFTEVSTDGQQDAKEFGVQGELLKLLHLFDQYSPDPLSSGPTTNGELSTKADLAKQKPRQFLSLRSNVNGSANTLFSGLQVQPESEKVKPEAIPDAVGLGLPNGFELTDFSALGGKESDVSKLEKRTFEKVFTSVRRLKPLDLPHTAKDVVRGNVLDFIPNSSRPENNPIHKGDYKHSKLPTGSWLSYRMSQQDRQLLQQFSTSTDFKAALAANHARQGKVVNEEELFSSSYSSFAPSSDNGYSLVSGEDLSQQWWNQYGEEKLSRFFRMMHDVDQHPAEMLSEDNDDEFADVVASFEPQEAEEDDTLSTEEKEVNTLLQEVTEMIETLSSYQRNRNLDIIASGKVQKPEKPEMDMFEMLRSQLSILIATLPPFAVAKLNGDQLEELNISTRLVIEVPDYPGTGQPDDYLLRRQKMALQATHAASRTATNTQPVRPNYPSGQANTAGYNSQVRSFNSSVPATAAYGLRGAQNYHSPTVARNTYSQTPTFQASTTTNANYSGNRPTIQQFQRPTMQNGFGSYGSSTPLQPASQPSQTPIAGAYGQRPTQPGYQQRAQENAAVLARSASPQKPQTLVNGAGQHYTPRQYQASTQSQQAQTHAQTAQQYAYQRQGSGTPTTPIAPATLSARFDTAVAPRPRSAQSGGGNTGQAMEVSR